MEPLEDSIVYSKGVSHAVPLALGHYENGYAYDSL